MKKLTKILAATLLLSLVLSCFGMFSAFAEEVTEEVVTTSDRVVVYDMDALEAATLSNAEEGDTITKVTDELGNTYWQIKKDSAKAGTYLSVYVSSPKSDYDKAIVFADVAETKSDDAGNFTPADNDGDGKIDIKYAKNTDFFIIDFDVSTDSTFLKKINFHSRTLSDTLSSALANVQQNGATYFYLNETHDGVVDVDGLTNVLNSNDKWTDVTIVYDVRADFDHAAVEAGTAFEGNAGHVYINGYYVCSVSAAWARAVAAYSPSLDYGKVFESFRLEIPTGGITGATTNFANFTISKLPVGYEGVISLPGVLGTASVSLQSIPELAYTQENAPKEAEPSKLADIKRGDETIAVYNVDDLCGNLVDGDVVVAYANLAGLKSFYTVKESAEGVAANVVWQDEAGVALGADGAKYAAPVVVSVPFAADWAIIRSGAVYKSGSNKTAAQGTSSNALVVDPFFDVLPEGNDVYNVVFYNDYVGYGRSGKSGEIDGVPTTQKGSSANKVGGKVLIDLNGYTFTNAAVYQHYFVGSAANYRVHFRNGNVVQNGVGNLVAATSPGYAGFIILENCNVDTIKGVIFDQRGGMVIYKDSTVKTESAMSNVKAIGEYKTGVTVINCDIDGGEGTLINLSQTNANNDAGGKTRQGSSGFFVRYEDSVIRTESTLATFETYANKDHNADEYKANLHDFFVDIKNCDIETYGTLISQTTALLPAEGDNILDIDIDLNVSGSTIQAFGLLNTGGNNDHALVDFDANINVEDAGLKLIRFEDNGHKALGGLVITQKALNINVNLAEGVKLDGFRAGRPASGYIGATVNLPEGANVVYSSLLGEGYNCFISSGATETYSYKLGEQEPVEFLWNVPAEGTDEVDVSRVVNLYEKEGFYHYTWAPYAGEKLFTTEFHNDYTLGAKANLTVFENFTFNLYIPASEYKAFSSLSILDNKGVAAEIVDTVEIDGVSYYKYSVAGLTPDMAEVSALSVSYEITAAYGETISGGKDVCVLDYLESYTSMEEGDEQELVKAIAQYVYYAYVLAGRDTTNVAPLVSGWGLMVPDRSTAKWDALAGVEVAVNYGNGLAWAFKAAAGTELAVTYYANGEAVDETIVVAENGYAYLPVLNCDYNQNVVVTIGENSASFNLVGYIYELVDLLGGAPMNGNTNIEMANAIYHFAREAAEYKLVLYPPVVEETPAEPAE